MAQPTVTSLARYRTVDEARIIELLLLHGWVLELRAGQRASAEPEARAALDRLVGLGLPYRRSEAGRRLFDPVETANFLRQAGLSQGEPTLTERCAPTARRLVTQAQAPGPRRYRVTIRRTFNLQHRRPGERVRLRLPLPLADAVLGDVRTEFLPPPGLVAETIAAPARLDVLTQVPNKRLVTVGVKAEFTTRPFASSPAAGLDAAEARLYRRPVEGLIHVSERVSALAGELCGGALEPWAILRRFWDFMLSELACGSIHYDELDPASPLDTVLDQGWYDCRVGSALLAALCRSRGIPARLVGGYMLHAASPAFHTWLEAWIEGAGWVPFDLFSWDLSAGGLDPEWRDYFFGRLDHRMAVERPPRLFSGTGAVRLPPAWQMLTALDGAGCAAEFLNADTGALVYREHVEVEQAVSPPA